MSIRFYTPTINGSLPKKGEKSSSSPDAAHPTLIASVNQCILLIYLPYNALSETHLTFASSPRAIPEVAAALCLEAGVCSLKVKQV